MIPDVDCSCLSSVSSSSDDEYAANLGLVLEDCGVFLAVGALGTTPIVCRRFVRLLGGVVLLSRSSFDNKLLGVLGVELFSSGLV